MRVSVVVPLFNKAPYIRRALDSIAAQTLSDFEVIIVDDGSTDRGDLLAERYPDSRFRLIRQPNAGPGAARNRGAAHARAPYLAFLDADDVWRPTFLEHNARILDAYPAALSSGGAWIDFPEARSTVPMWSRRGIREGLVMLSPATRPRQFNQTVNFMVPSTTMIRASAFRDCGGYYEAACRFGEDGVLWLKLLLGGTVYFHLQPLTEFHREASALSGNYKGARPVEPYLTDPSAMRGFCPPDLQPLLESFYAARACKTACMLAYWGEWRRARRLLRQFARFRHWAVPLFGAAHLAATPAGAIAGRLLRRLTRRIPAPANGVAAATRGAAAGR